ncbi:L10-interacting MYB domain-containing protein-like isoform X1 [Papaver somniferum]|uniref:L10-interacting MYB domain-containing protein-like isoform X1 n=2 Tax=Papaver somniferum TaxID=3469 RepID=UPI000E7051FA|nr:L10-interacting MYB domain-containing protein-like isoform X1 [Papaver somniferum]
MNPWIVDLEVSMACHQKRDRSELRSERSEKLTSLVGYILRVFISYLLGIICKLLNMESDQSSNPQTGRTTWTPPMDRLFIGLMEDQVQKGQLLDGQFNKYAWTHFVDNFKQSFGSSFTKDVLKNRMKTLKKNYVAVSTLRGQSGFGWDQSREIVTADDAVWDDYIKKHPDVKCWRTKTLAHFDELAIIFGDNKANGRYSRCRNDNTVQDDDDHDNLVNV